MPHIAFFVALAMLASILADSAVGQLVRPRGDPESLVTAPLAPSGARPDPCRNDGPEVDPGPNDFTDRTNGLRLVNEEPLSCPTPAPNPLIVPGYFYEIGNHAFHDLMFFQGGVGYFQRYRWISPNPNDGNPIANDPGDPQTFSWNFGVGGSTVVSEYGATLVAAGDFTGINDDLYVTSHGDELVFYTPHPTGITGHGRIALYKNVVSGGPQGFHFSKFASNINEDVSPPTLKSGSGMVDDWTGLIAGHFSDAVSNYKDNNIASLAFYKKDAGIITALQVWKYTGSTADAGFVAHNPTRVLENQGVDQPSVSSLHNLGPNETAHWTDVVGGRFYRDGDHALRWLQDDLFFYDSVTGHWAVMVIRQLDGAVLRVLSSLDADLNNEKQPRVEIGWSGIIAGRFGASFTWTDVCFYNVAQQSLLIRHPSGFMTDGEPAAIKHPFTQLIAGDFAVANPENDNPPTPADGTWRYSKPDDLKHNLPQLQFQWQTAPFTCSRNLYQPTQYEDFLCYQAPPTGQGSGTMNFWRYKPGNEWVRAKMEGYVRPASGIGESVAPGEELEFHISSSTRTDPVTHQPHSDILEIKVYRKGAPEVQMPGVLYALAQEEAVADDGVYLLGCGWPVSAKLTIPSTWKSGLYVAKIRSMGCDCGCGTEIPFVVRAADPGQTSKILVCIPTTTYQAYNWWGGRNFYGHGVGARGTPGANGDWTAADAHRPWQRLSEAGVDPYDVGANAGFYGGTRAFKLSSDRPYMSLADFPNIKVYPEEVVAERPELQYWEVPFIEWMDRHGFQAEYCTSFDLDRAPISSEYRLVISIGHDEYWSYNMKHNVQDFVGAGGNAAFFSANTCWWQIRFSSDGRQMTCYKDIAHENAENTPQGLWTTQWSGYAWNPIPIGGSTGCAYPYYMSRSISPSTFPFWPPTSGAFTDCANPPSVYSDPEVDLTGVTWINSIAGWPAWYINHDTQLHEPFRAVVSQSNPYLWMLKDDGGNYVLQHEDTFGYYTDQWGHPQSIVGWETDAVVQTPVEFVYKKPALAGDVFELAHVIYNHQLYRWANGDNGMQNMVDRKTIVDPVRGDEDQHIPSSSNQPPSMGSTAMFTRLIPPSYTALYNSNPALGPVRGTTFTAGTMDWVFGLTKTASLNAPLDIITKNVLKILGEEDYCPGGSTSAGWTEPPQVSAGELVLATVSVNKCSPVASPTWTVTLDLAPIGGSSSTGMHDDGSNGDVTSGDGVFSLTVQTPGSLTGGAYVLPYSVSDGTQVAMGSIQLSISGSPAPATIDGTGQTQPITGNLGFDEVHIFRIQVCTGFSATTEIVGVNNFDTQLFLFDNDFNGIACNDDVSVNSQKSSITLPNLPRGAYYLAISAYNKDPHIDASSPPPGNPFALVFPDTPFTSQLGPYSPTEPLDHWDTNVLGSEVGAYRIDVNGLCACCTMDFNGDGDSATDADIEAFFACLANNCCATCSTADFDCDGDTGTDADIEAFFRVLAGAPC